MWKLVEDLAPARVADKQRRLVGEVRLGAAAVRTWSSAYRSAARPRSMPCGLRRLAHSAQTPRPAEQRQIHPRRRKPARLRPDSCKMSDVPAWLRPFVAWRVACRGVLQRSFARLSGVLRWWAGCQPPCGSIHFEDSREIPRPAKGDTAPADMQPTRLPWAVARPGTIQR